jgi:hypothetical protein
MNLLENIEEKFLTNVLVGCFGNVVMLTNVVLMTTDMDAG